jgi:hypothetical protein
MSDYLENKLVDHIFRGRTYTAPTTIFIGLFTVAPSDSGGGTEVTGGSYARVQHGPSDTTWEATQGGTPAAASSGTGGATQNAGTITFPVPTGNWGQVVAIGIFDAVTGGNLLFYGTLTNPKNVNTGDPAPFFPAGALDVVIG